MSTQDFSRRYSELITAASRYRKATDWETVKVRSALFALANRASDLHYGLRPGAESGWQIAGMDENTLISKAESYLSDLDAGRRPLLGKFAEPGQTLVDHSFLMCGDTLHVYYNISHIGYDWPERYVDSIGHAYTADLFNWTICPPALTLEPGGFDEYQIWSPSVLRHGGKYYMFYTGVNRHVAQAACLAEADDPYDFRRVSASPVYTPGKMLTWSPDCWSDCRDHMVMQDGERWYMYYCGSKDGRGTTGIAVSDDLLHWRDEAAFAPASCSMMPESPFVLKKDGMYWLFYTNCGRGTAYAVSPSPTGPFAERGMLIEAEPGADSSHVPSCSEVFAFKGKWYISWATRMPGGEEQYLELAELHWHDGGCTVGERVTSPV